ncbi:hypothetical protein L0244_13765, partial [bacterium]|nr:hypothetical protein [bacterium]
SLRWKGKSGAIMSLDSQYEFSGVLLFRIFVRETVPLELRAGGLHKVLKLEPGWRWIELDDITLEKGMNRFTFNLIKDKARMFQISNVTYFGRQVHTNLSAVFP